MVGPGCGLRTGPERTICAGVAGVTFASSIMGIAPAVTMAQIGAWRRVQQFVVILMRNL